MKTSEILLKVGLSSIIKDLLNTAMQGSRSDFQEAFIIFILQAQSLGLFEGDDTGDYQIFFQLLDCTKFEDCFIVETMKQLVKQQSETP